MDYSRLTSGATVYLPVFHPGAFLYIGDGHAAQGDGEIAGNALETSMDVTFSVSLIKRAATKKLKVWYRLKRLAAISKHFEFYQRATIMMINYDDNQKICEMINEILLIKKYLVLLRSLNLYLTCL
jgi:acetamidase/formamidase